MVNMTFIDVVSKFDTILDRNIDNIIDFKGGKFSKDGDTVLLFWFNEDFGINVNDLSGNNNNGTFTNYVSWDSGKFGRGIKINWNDISSYIVVLHNTSLNFGTGNFTIELWVKPITIDKSTDDGFVYDKNSGGAGDIDLRIGWDILCADVAGGSSSVPTSSDCDISDGNWHHVKLFLRGLRVQVILDGKCWGRYKGGDTFSGLSTDSTADVGIGYSVFWEDYQFWYNIGGIKVSKSTNNSSGF